MANNPYVNKVVYGNDTVMDISDTTATEGDVVNGKTFYKANGQRSTGTASMSTDWGDIGGTLSDQTDLQNALNGKANSVHTHTKSDITDFPTIPTVNNGQLTIQQNGTNKATFTANQSTNATANIITDDWVKTASVSNGSVTFSGIDDSGNYGYEVFFNITSSSINKNPTAQLSSISGEGTSNMSLTYTTDADNGTNNAKLRRIR